MVFCIFTSSTIVTTIWFQNIFIIPCLQPTKKPFENIKWSEVKSHEVAQSCPTLCDPMDYSPPGSSVHGIFQAWILEWVAIPLSRRSSRPRDRTRVAGIVGRRFTVWATREALENIKVGGIGIDLFGFKIFYAGTVAKTVVLTEE